MADPTLNTQLVYKKEAQGGSQTPPVEAPHTPAPSNKPVLMDPRNAAQQALTGPWPDVIVQITDSLEQGLQKKVNFLRSLVIDAGQEALTGPLFREIPLPSQTIKCTPSLGIPTKEEQFSNKNGNDHALSPGGVEHVQPITATVKEISGIQVHCTVPNKKWW